MDERCEQALQTLWPLTEPDGLDSPERTAAREHVERCGACRAYLRRDASLEKRLRGLKTAGTSGLSDAFRAELRMRLMSDGETSEEDADVRSIKSSRRQRWRHWTEGIAAAAAIALIAGGLAISQSIEAPLADGAFTNDFMRTELHEIVSGNVTPAQVTAFYAEQFGERMDPARLLDARVTRVAVCDVEGRRGAMVEYELGGERLVYYQLPLDGRRATADLHLSREGSLNVARWGDDRSEHVLVSSLPAENLEEYAQQRMD